MVEILIIGNINPNNSKSEEIDINEKTNSSKN